MQKYMGSCVTQIHLYVRWSRVPPHTPNQEWQALLIGQQGDHALRDNLYIRMLEISVSESHYYRTSVFKRFLETTRNPARSHR